ncbi:nagb/rpia/CoA transferase-like protein [Sistotremastrum niveocremeum HHB9708]|uniref:Translation initiation factor eIF2B subunit alpha n=1 Tax=Sistotremastrum niveocremeum HHB9708 TaxID=1314777 RepID=A0A164QR37_9AGAM|nr:nagb/rpia/CoA transferase-like protein [Sistotremastrum niveocremeum HHB9708]
MSPRLAPPSAVAAQTISESSPIASPPFDIIAAYRRILNDDSISMPVAAILALVELIEFSTAGTTFELVQALTDGAEQLKSRTPNSISLSAGVELFVAFVTLFPHESDSFDDLKAELVSEGRKYAQEAQTYRAKIAEFTFKFIKDNAVILTHSYSRVVMHALLHAHKHKRISVYVTEARPRGLGIKTCEALTALGVPCTVVLDSAVAYLMDKVDVVLVGSEAVVESGGLINAVGSYQLAIIAKAHHKPFYALAESYKFHRLFPLSQYDLPTHTPNILSFPRAPASSSAPGLGSPSASYTAALAAAAPPPTPARGLSSTNLGHPPPASASMTSDQLARNPEVDYTRPDLITLVFSDVGILTPSGVSQYLVGMFAG